jgi:hypothetical protein
LNSQINYYVDTDLEHLILVDSQTGDIYANPALKNEKNSLCSDKRSFIYKFIVIAKDNGIELRQTSKLEFKIEFICENSDVDVYFTQSLYYFNIDETIKINEQFGQIDSIEYFNSNFKTNKNIIYSIIEGDDNDHFEIDYSTGIFYNFCCCFVYKF